MLSEIKQSQKGKNSAVALYEISKMVKFIETQSRAAVCQEPGSGRGRNRTLFNGTRFRFCKTERVLEMDGDDSQQCACTELLCCSSKMVKMADFYVMYILPQWKKKHFKVLKKNSKNRHTFKLGIF